MAGAVGESPGPVVIDGYIDLLYEREDGFVIVDYKTDSFDPENVADLVERYRWQLATYAAVVERNLGRPVVKASLLLIGAANEAAVELPVVDLRGTVDSFPLTVAQLTGGDGA